MNFQPQHSIKLRGGFSLAELLFALAIGTFILTGVMSSYIFGVKSFRGLSNYNEMQADGRVSLDWLGRDIHPAMTISNCMTNQVVVLLPRTVNYASGVVTSTNVVTHWCQNGAWYRREGTNAFKMLATNVTSLTFSFYNKAGSATMQAAQAVSVQVDAILSKTVGNNQQTSEFLSARYRMRNTP